MDAAVMTGQTLLFGAVTALQGYIYDLKFLLLFKRNETYIVLKYQLKLFWLITSNGDDINKSRDTCTIIKPIDIFLFIPDSQDRYLLPER